MRIRTLTCPECETIVAENVLEEERVMKCPYFECEEILSFEDLPKYITTQVTLPTQAE